MQCARNVQLPFDFGGKIMPGKTKAKKGDGAVNRILEDANSTRFWVHTYDDDPISRLPSKIREHKAFIASYR